MNSKSKGRMTNGEGAWNSYTGRSLDGVFLGIADDAPLHWHIA
jgi:hypothetical protein